MVLAEADRIGLEPGETRLLELPSIIDGEAAQID